MSLFWFWLYINYVVKENEMEIYMFDTDTGEVEKREVNRTFKEDDLLFIKEGKNYYIGCPSWEKLRDAREEHFRTIREDDLNGGIGFCAKLIDVNLDKTDHFGRWLKKQI
jgi:hypothetical protein